MAHSDGGVPRIDRALEAVVEAINAMTELHVDGPGVVLTVGGLVISGTVIPDWQWFDEVEHQARAAFVVHTGGSIDDEHGGWARLFGGVAESLVQARDERQAAREAAEHLSARYRRCLAQDDRAEYIHLRDARVIAPGVGSQPVAGMHWRGRLSEVSGWSFGHFGAEPPTRGRSGEPGSGLSG
jgi:hypothetical protein